MHPIIGHRFIFCDSSTKRDYDFCEMCKNKDIPAKHNLKPSTKGKHYNCILSHFKVINFIFALRYHVSISVYAAYKEVTNCKACEASLIYGCVYHCVKRFCGYTYCTDCVDRGNTRRKGKTQECIHRFEVFSLKKGIL